MAIKVGGIEIVDNSRNIVNIGTVDGRDVATDGTKLDSIKENADVTTELGTVTGNATLDLSTGNFFEFTPTEYSTTTFVFNNPPASGTAYSFDLNITGEYFNSSYDLTNATFDSVNIQVSSQDSTPWDVAFNTDGTKMFILGNTNNVVLQYTLSTPFVVNTATYDNVSLSVSAQDGTPQSMAFSSDGTELYVLGDATDAIYQYTLSTGFDLSTASYSGSSLSVSGQDTFPRGVAISNDGTKIYMCGTNTDRAYQYSMTTAFDLSTASYDSISRAIGGNNPLDIEFNSDGTKVYLLANGSNSVVEYPLSTPFALDTVGSSSASFSVSSQTNSPVGITFNSTGTKLYVVDLAFDKIFQYTTGKIGLAEFTYPASVTWLDAAAPTDPADGEVLSLTFSTTDGGTTYYGFKNGASASVTTGKAIAMAIVFGG